MPSPETLKMDLNSEVTTGPEIKLPESNPTPAANVMNTSFVAPKPAVSTPNVKIANPLLHKPQRAEDHLCQLLKWLRDNNGSLHYQRDQNLFTLQNARHQAVSLSVSDLLDNPETIPSKLRDAYAAL